MMSEELMKRLVGLKYVWKMQTRRRLRHQPSPPGCSVVPLALADFHRLAVNQFHHTFTFVF